MTHDLLEKIITYVDDHLESHQKRLNHIKGVSETAAMIASYHHIDPLKARIAGYIHDLTKKWPIEKHLELLSEEDLGVYKDYPFFYHGLSAAKIAQDIFHIDDLELLDSIKYHSTGRKNMKPLEQVILISDMAEPNRLWDTKSLLDVAYLDLNQATHIAVTMKLKSNEANEKNIHPYIKETIAFYKEHTWKRFD
jgi:predicted HD superfamily hydrolase involved in NAD metabolism